MKSDPVPRTSAATGFADRFGDRVSVGTDKEGRGTVSWLAHGAAGREWKFDLGTWGIERWYRDGGSLEWECLDRPWGRRHEWLEWRGYGTLSHT